MSAHSFKSAFVHAGLVDSSNFGCHRSQQEQPACVDCGKLFSSTSTTFDVCSGRSERSMLSVQKAIVFFPENALDRAKRGL